MNISVCTVFVKKKNTLFGHKSGIYCLEQSSQNNMIFSASGDGSIVSWNLLQPENSNLIAKFPRSIYSIKHLNRGNVLCVGHNYEGIYFLDIKNKKIIEKVLFTKAPIFALVKHKNRLIVGDGAGNIAFISLDNYTLEQQIKVSNSSVRTFAINDKEELVAGLSDNRIIVLNLANNTFKNINISHKNSVFSTSFTKDFGYLLSAGRDARLKFWDVNNNYQLIDDIIAHIHTINDIVFSPNGEYFVTGSMDKTIKVWNTKERKLIKVLDKKRHSGHTNSVNKLLWTSFENNLMISGSDDKTIGIWNLTIKTNLTQ